MKGYSYFIDNKSLRGSLIPGGDGAKTRTEFSDQKANNGLFFLFVLLSFYKQHMLLTVNTCRMFILGSDPKETERGKSHPKS